MPKTKPSFSRRRKRTSRSNIIRNLCNKSCAQNSVNETALEMEIDENSPPTISQVIKGRRIVDLAYVLSQYENIANRKFSCTMGRMDIQREVKQGLLYFWHFECGSCNKKVILRSEPPQQDKDVNNKVVWGCLSIGIGHSQCEELFGVLDVPFMNINTFTNNTLIVKKESRLADEMKLAGEEEKRLAIEQSHWIQINNEIIPYVTVIIDGGWSKRTYGHGYDASSGVAVIIGAATKKILYAGVRNKMCSTCEYYKEDTKKHECSLNFSGPSIAMESSIIVEGFSKSLQQHGLIYKKFIGDGDSNVYAKIQERVFYGRYLIKIECANHMTRCFSQKLHNLSKNTHFSLQGHKLLQEKDNGIERLVKGIRTAIKNCEKNNHDAQQLRNTLSNAPFHVFGHHINCWQ